MDERNPLTVVCVAPHVPSAGVDHAGGAFLHRYLTFLAEDVGWRVLLVVPGTPANLAVIDRSSVATTSYPSVAPTAVPRAVWRLVHHGVNMPSPRRWVSGLPRSLDEAFARADVIDLQWSESATLAPALRSRYTQAVVVATAHDVLAQSVRRARRAERRVDRVRSWLATPRVSRVESEGLDACDLISVFNPVDVDLLRSMGVTAPIQSIPPAVALEVDVVPARGSRTVLFLGAMWRPENDEGARWLLDEVMPRVWRWRPDVRVRIAGARPSSWLVSRNDRVVEVTGYLADLSDAYRDVAVVTVPLRRGAGLKFKTVQSLAYGYQTVSTSVGAEGVREAFPSVRNLHIHDDAAAFAAAVIAALDGMDAQHVDHDEIYQLRSSLDLDAALAVHAARCVGLVEERRSV